VEAETGRTQVAGSSDGCALTLVDAMSDPPKPDDATLVSRGQTTIFDGRKSWSVPYSYEGDEESHRERDGDAALHAFRPVELVADDIRALQECKRGGAVGKRPLHELAFAKPPQELFHSPVPMPERRAPASDNGVRVPYSEGTKQFSVTRWLEIVVQSVPCSFGNQVRRKKTAMKGVEQAGWFDPCTRLRSSTST
jgi:hypothetical protein